MKKHFALFYGTLRSGGVNDRFSGKKYIKTLTLDDYDLYFDYGLPFAVQTEKGAGHLVVELCELESDTAQSIRWMELGAGYSEQEIKIDDIIASIYICNEAKDFAKKVEGGDFIKFLELTEN